MFKKILYVLIIIGLVFGAIGFQTPKPVQAANPLRISQVYANSGMQTSFYKQNYVELFNSSSSPISLAGYSLQFGTGSGKIDLFNAPMPEKTIPAGGYLLIQTFDFEVGQSSIPTPDVTLIVNVDNVSGKIALVNGTEALDCGSVEVPCSDEQKARIVDMVGYGPHASFYEGSAAAPSPTVILSVQRKAAGCQDTDQNGADFETLTPAARNSASPTHSCQPLGDPANLRLSQVYGGGGGANATYTHDFIEIFNAGSAPVSLDGLSLQYASATGTGNFGASAAQLTELPNVTLEAGQYFLVEQASGTNGVALPTPDYIDPTPIGMSATNGKVALVTGTTTLGCNGGSTPCNADQTARIIDLVGFGNANFYEGTQAAPVLSSTLSAQRKQGGCQDTNQNGDDFTAETPAARNTASPTHSCGPVVYPERFIISEYIEGSGQNKAIELYNGTGAAIDLSGYRIDYYNSSVGTVTQTLALTGTLENGDVYVIVTDQSDQAMKDVADLILAYPSVVHFNGDDSLVLVRVADGAVQDSFGDIDNDPGAYWGDETVKTQDQTLVRKAYVCQGDTTPDDDFVPALQYDPHPIDTFTHLGSHTMDCSITPPTAPTVQSIAPANNAVVPGTTDIVVTFSENVTVAEGWYDITCTQSGAHTADVTDANPVFTLNPDTDFTSGETCTVTIDKDKVTNAANETMAENYVSSFSIVEGCGDALTPIYAIQGEGAASPVVNEIVTTEGVVTANFQVGGKSGYAIQDPNGDGNTATSDGIFVYSTNPTVNVGDRLRITGKVTEYYNMTQITPTSAATVLTCSTGQEITPTEITLPVTAPRDFEQYEGMLVTFPQALYLAEYFNFDRYGEIVLSGTRHNTPTSVVEPGDAAIAAEEAYQLDSIKVDDTLTSQNPPYLRHPDGSQFTKEHYFRGGDTIKGLTGIMDYNFNEWKIQPVGEATFAQMNLRPEAPSLAPGEIRIASMNVLNYFVTLDNAGNICGPGGNVNCRGADNQEEFERQHDKIVAAILGMEADVIGLMEIENEHPNMEADGAVKNLVEGLNASAGDGTYDYVATGAIGTDAIKQAFIYKPAKVDRVGKVAILDETFDAAYDTTKNRPSLAVSFKDKITDEIFTVSVNHLKSKGSVCDGDPDLGDGQGDCNLTRKRAAEVLVSWLEDDPTEANSDMYVIIGDLNSYAKEDPIDAIKLGADKTAGTADDVTNLVEEFNEPEAYGYVFDGKAGYLDHALANKKFAYYVLDAKFWHINADEADVFDYDTSFKPAEQAALYSPDAYRSSDHDPILISLTLIKPPTISSEDMAGPYLVTREQIFNVKLENPMSGATYQQISADVKMAGATLDTIEKIEFEHPLQAGTWIEITPESDGSDGIKAAVGPYPADVYFAPGAAPVLKFRITFAEVGEFETTGSLYDASGTGEPVLLVSYTDTMVVKAKPTLSEEGLAGPYKVGEAKTFVITMNNPLNGMAFASPKGIVELSRADGEVIVETDVNSVEVEFPYDSDNWLDLKDNTTIVDGKAVMDVGPLTGLEITVPQEMSLRYRINFAKGGVYNVTGTLYDSAWEPDFALASLTGVMNVLYDKPVISSADMAGPYLVTREQIFNVKLENPTSGATYQQISADVKMAGATLDTNEKIEFEHPLQAGTWIEITPELDGSDGIKAAVGPYPADVYFAPGEAPVLKFRITFAEVGEFETTGSLYDASGTGDPVLLVSYTDTMVVKAKPTLSETGLAGPYKVGEAKTFVITMNNPDNGMAFASPKGIVELSRADGEVIVETDVNSVEVEFPYDSDNWLDLKDNTTIVDGKAVMDVGPLTGLEITVPQEMSLRYRINFAKGGVYNVTGTLYDSAWEPDFALASLTGVMNVYHAPVAVDDAYTTDEDVALTVEAPGVLANDTDPDSPVLTAVLEEGPTHGTLELNANGSFTYTPELNYHGTDSFTYKASDGTNESNVATVTITINSVNDAPVAVDDAYTVAEDAVLTVAAAEGVLANDYDVDGDALAATLRTNVSHGVLVLLSDGSFTYTPNADFFGTDSFTYTLLSHPNTQDEGWTDWATVTITVTPVNDAPVLDPIDDAAIPELEAYTFTATATDIDSTNLTFSLVDAPEGAAIGDSSGVFTWTPTEAQGPQAYTFTVKVCDDGTPSLCDEQEVTITVEEVNQAPVLDPIGDKEVDELTELAFTVTATDADLPAQTLTFSMDDAPEGAEIDPSTGEFTWTPTRAQVGEHTVKICVSDGELEDCETITITVNFVNQAPVAVADEYETTKNVELIVEAPGVLENDTDEDDDELTVVLGETVQHGILELNADGSFTYTPNEDFVGEDSFTYKAFDGTDHSELVTVTITVLAPPVWGMFFPIILN